MRTLFYILICLALKLPVCGQETTQVIITAVERTDWTFEKKNEQFLRNNVIRHQVIYSLGTVSQSLKTNKYLADTYSNIWDGDTIVKEKLKTKYKKWSNQIDSAAFQNLLASLQRDIDTLEKNMGILHTSHHYLNIYIDVVHRGDTTSYRKTKPFEYLTPWWTEKYGGVLNPAIDNQILVMLPDRFIGKEKLKIIVPSRFKQD